MKKSLKLISVLLVFAIMSTFMTISSSALATPFDAGESEETTTTPAPVVPAAKELVRLNIDTMPTKTTFVVDENFNSSGLLVSAIYNDGSRKRITNYNLSGFDSSAEGISVVTISYTEGDITQTVTYECTIVAELENTDEGDGGFDFSLNSIFDLLTLFVNFIAKASEWLLNLWTNL